MAGKTKQKPQKRQAAMRPCEYCGEQFVVAFGRWRQHQATCAQKPTFEDEGSLPPGTILDRGTGAPRKKKWATSDILKAYPKSGWKTFIPVRTCPVTVFGHTIQLQEGVEISCPSIFYDIYWASVQSDRDITSPRQMSDLMSRAVPYERDTGLRVVGQGLPRP